VEMKKDKKDYNFYNSLRWIKTQLIKMH
jgi:hypothetical protein